MTKIAVVGGGRIGEALIAGLLESGWAAANVTVIEPVAARAAQLAGTYGVTAGADMAAAALAELVVIAVKPGDVDTVAGDLAKVELDTGREQLVVSLAAGIPTARLQARLPEGCPVVRVMPNTPMLVGKGMSAIAGGRYAQPHHLEQVAELLRAVGTVVTVPESQLDAVTAVSGSGPAYVFLIAEAMIDAGVSLGLSREVASTLVAQTMVGSAAMLAGEGNVGREALPRPATSGSARNTDRNVGREASASPATSGAARSTEGAGPADLRAAVTSPGGTTAAAVRVLERSGVRSAFLEALHAARDRSVELGG